MTTIKRIPPKSIYNNQYKPQQQIQEQKDAVVKEDVYQIKNSLENNAELDSTDTTNSVLSECQNNRISEVKQEKKLRSIEDVYLMKNKVHGGRVGTHIVSGEPNKRITAYSDGYRIMYDKITKTITELPRVDFTKCKSSDIWSYKN